MICTWLRDVLMNGARDVSEVRAAAIAAGFTKAELRKAKILLDVRSVHISKDVWLWSLPERGARDAGATD